MGVFELISLEKALDLDLSNLKTNKKHVIVPRRLEGSTILGDQNSLAQVRENDFRDFDNALYPDEEIDLRNLDLRSFPILGLRVKSAEKVRFGEIYTSEFGTVFSSSIERIYNSDIGKLTGSIINNLEYTDVNEVKFSEINSMLEGSVNYIDRESKIKNREGYANRRKLVTTFKNWFS